MITNELRLGNYIYWNIPYKMETKTIHKVVLINEKTINTNPISLGLDICDYLPIPLTEDWLIKFGFEKTDMDFYNITLPDKYKVYLSCTMILGRFEVCQSSYGFCVDCKYVHQLQNLYFALTGKELTIKS